jgi:hypothetical protein
LLALDLGQTSQHRLGQALAGHLLAYGPDAAAHRPQEAAQGMSTKSTGQPMIRRCNLQLPLKNAETVRYIGQLCVTAKQRRRLEVRYIADSDQRAVLLQGVFERPYLRSAVTGASRVP